MILSAKFFGSVPCRDIKNKDAIRVCCNLNGWHLLTVPTIKKGPEFIEVYNSGDNSFTVNPLTNNQGIIHVYNIIVYEIIQEDIKLTKSQICLPTAGSYIYRFISKTGEIQNGKIVAK